MPTRNASATWEGGLKGGKGSFSGESGAVGASYSFGTRFEHAPGTNPEELLAAAEAACYSMALSADLEKAGTPAERVQTDAACTLDFIDGKPTITTMRLRVRAKVPGIDAATLDKAAQDTKVGCPVSRALTGVDIQVEATLE
ncbi:MAG: OsmC family peroxiredoxin [Gemmatimonadetes bacterium]|nr:OsmC family peroxiredoxin [Gemmatimonadota bacterium]